MKKLILVLLFPVSTCFSSGLVNGTISGNGSVGSGVSTSTITNIATTAAGIVVSSNWTQIAYVDPNGTSSGVLGNASKPFALLSQAAVACTGGQRIIINPGSYFDTVGNISLSNGVTVSAYGVNYTVSNANSGAFCNIIPKGTNNEVDGGTWNLLTSSPGDIGGMFGTVVGPAFGNFVLRDVTVHSQDGCFKYSYTGISDAWFFNCTFDGDYAGFTCEGTSGGLTNHIFDCFVTLTNTIQPLNYRTAFKIRGQSAGTYFIQNCHVVISDAGITNFASGITTGHVPSGAGGSLNPNTFFANGLTFDMTQCTNPLSFNINVHSLTNAITLNNCWNVNGSRLTWSNYNIGVYPFQTNYYFAP